MTPALLLLADGRFPAGGHAYSAGVEAAVRAGDVTDLVTMDRYLRGRLASSGVTDAAVAARSSGIARGLGLDGTFDELDAEYEARVLSPRVRGVSRRLGRQLCRGARTTWPHPALDTVAAIASGPHQPIALGAAVVAAGGDAHDAAVISVHHLATAVVSATVRLLGLDPISCAAAQAGAVDWAATLIADARAWAVTPPSALPGSGGTLTEILGEHHGTWDHRLFVG